MKSLKFNKVEFIKSCVWTKDYPVLRDEGGNKLPEIALVGRSNVGKSSLINHLFKRKNIAKTSATPGKTQTLNFFTIDDQLAVVDLPGYGYANVPQSVKKTWGPMMKEYLEGRTELALLVLLLDIRRNPNEDDLAFFEWARYHDVPIVFVFTKVDKVKSNEKAKNTKKILSAFAVNDFPFVYYSTSKNIGRNQLIQMIDKNLKPSDQKQDES